MTASGPLTLPYENARLLVAECPAWQTWVNAPAAGQAAGRVFLFAADPPEDEVFTAEELEIARPWAIVNQYVPPEVQGGRGFVASRVGEPNCFEHGGKLTITFEADVPQEYAGKPGAAMTWFLNQVGAVVGEMLSLSGQDERLSIHELETYLPAMRSAVDEDQTQGDYIAITLLVTWGV